MQDLFAQIPLKLLQEVRLHVDQTDIELLFLFFLQQL